MKTDEIREKFLSFFESKKHKRLPSASLVPHDDPTLLFTNAGMVQFKKVFLGEIELPYTRATTVQKCVRAGGKHNDLERVGKTLRHHTFFEMLGNFSFGDYFKEEAIEFAWELMTKEFNLPQEQLWVSVYKDDEEGFKIWKKVIGLNESRILKLGEEENFWSMGDTGPCGPCSEIIIDRGEKTGCGKPDCNPTCDCDRYLELWNLVFMEFNRKEDGGLEPLPRKCIDTGMGLERVASVLQEVNGNYEIDIIKTLIEEVETLSGFAYGKNDKVDMAIRVIIDHSRAGAFLIADGVLPSNEGRGYVIRRMLRRAVRFGRKLNLKEPFLWKVAEKVVEVMKIAYPELEEHRKIIRDAIKSEEERFGETLDRGLKIFYTELGKIKSKEFPAEIAFKLYDTYGFPPDIMRDLLEEENKTLNVERFNELLERQRQMGKEGWKEVTAKSYEKLLRKEIKVKFTGYTKLEDEGEVLFLLKDGTETSFINEGEEGEVVINPTPFYGEAGGQVGDRGDLIWDKGRAKVLDAQKPFMEIIYLKVKVEHGKLKKGITVKEVVDAVRRKKIAIHHTLTHLLQAALRKEIGSHVRQMGSLVAPERLRFDFSHTTPLSDEEIRKIETTVNKWIGENIKVSVEEKEYGEALKEKAIALFEEKYGAKVRVVKIGGISKELCGGTHLSSTGEARVFKIVAQSSVQAGVRRVEAVGGEEALNHIYQTETLLYEIQNMLESGRGELKDRLKGLLNRIEELERENEYLKKRIARMASGENLRETKIEDITLITGIIDGLSAKELGEIVDRNKENRKKAIILIGTSKHNKGLIICGVTNDLKNEISASEVLKEIGKQFGGGGGGRPDFAQGGITKANDLNAVIQKLPEIVSKFKK